MKTFLIIFQIVVSILLILSILSQEKGVGLGAGFGGSGEATFRGRRGVDRVLLWISISLAILFIASSLLFLFTPDDGLPEVTTPSGLEGIEIEPLEIEPGSIETEPVPKPAN